MFTNPKRIRVIPEMSRSHLVDPIYIPISNRSKIDTKRKSRSLRQTRICFYSEKQQQYISLLPSKISIDKVKFAHRLLNTIRSRDKRKSRDRLFIGPRHVYYHTFYYIIDIFEKLFIYHRECQVVIYKRCQFAVNPASVKGHIQSKHKTVTKEQYTRVIVFIGSLSQVTQDPEQVKYPNASSPAIPGILVYTNRLRCVFETEG